MDNFQDYRFFDVVDYVVFAAMLILSALIGVYFAFFAKSKQNTTAEYLMGGKKMGIFPISMSLVARYVNFNIFYSYIYSVQSVEVPSLPKNINGTALNCVDRQLTLFNACPDQIIIIWTILYKRHV